MRPHLYSHGISLDFDGGYNDVISWESLMSSFIGKGSKLGMSAASNWESEISSPIRLSYKGGHGGVWSVLGFRPKLGSVGRLEGVGGVVNK